MKNKSRNIWTQWAWKWKGTSADKVIKHFMWTFIVSRIMKKSSSSNLMIMQTMGKTWSWRRKEFASSRQLSFSSITFSSLKCEYIIVKAKYSRSAQEENEREMIAVQE